jgi:hypothetical protein
MVTVSNAPHHHSLRSGFGHYDTGSDKIRALRVARGTPDTSNGVKHQPPKIGLWTTQQPSEAPVR